MKLTESKLRSIIREELNEKLGEDITDPEVIADRIEGQKITWAGSGMRDQIFIMTTEDGSQISFNPRTGEISLT